jgi:hypothetical protein
MKNEVIAKQPNEQDKNINTEKEWIRYLRKVRIEELSNLSTENLLSEVKLSMATSWFNVRYFERVKVILLKNVDKLTKADQKILVLFTIVTDYDRAISLEKMSDEMLIQASERMLECGYGNQKFSGISRKILSSLSPRLTDRQRIALYGLLNVSWESVLKKAGIPID